MNLKSAFQRRFILILGMIVIIFLLGVGFVIQQSLTAEASGIPTPTLTLNPGIGMLQNELQNPNMNINARHNVETKVAIELRDATEQAEAQTYLPAIRPSPQKNPILPPNPTLLPNEQPEVGILNGISYPNPQFHAENGWQEKINGDYVMVYAGVDGQDPTDGVLIIVGLNHTAANFIDMPGSGSLKIIDFKGNQLVLQSKNKGVFYFDVAGQSFIQSLGEIVPTITPKPTYPAITYSYP
jgi:hypothetical protein